MRSYKNKMGAYPYNEKLDPKLPATDLPICSSKNSFRKIIAANFLLDDLRVLHIIPHR